MSVRNFTFLGTGTSVGVPMLGCECRVCTSDDPRNHRFRCSVLLRLPAGNLLIDTGPELRLQLLRARVRAVHSVLFTHYHADHLMGLDDLRPIGKIIGKPVPLYCTGEVEGKIRKTFSYAFDHEIAGAARGWVPNLAFQRIDDEPFEVLGEKVTPIPLIHAQFDVYGFRVGDVAYCTDVSEIPRKSWPRLEGLKVLILDALRYHKHPAHFGLNEALDMIAKFRPERAYLTHMSHELEYEEVTRNLPSGVELAYDGLSFDF
ncbi:MAG: MBL fold metallo-hydrolase [Planctomycetia bacterium]|nr:MBL fold metallo-hydrolase [Planctomycetia bacterium]